MAAPLKHLLLLDLLLLLVALSLHQYRRSTRMRASCVMHTISAVAAWLFAGPWLAAHHQQRYKGYAMHTTETCMRLGNTRKGDRSQHPSQQPQQAPPQATIKRHARPHTNLVQYCTAKKGNEKHCKCCAVWGYTYVIPPGASCMDGSCAGMSTTCMHITGLSLPLHQVHPSWAVHRTQPRLQGAAVCCASNVVQHTCQLTRGPSTPPCSRTEARKVHSCHSSTPATCAEPSHSLPHRTCIHAHETLCCDTQDAPHHCTHAVCMAAGCLCWLCSCSWPHPELTVLYKGLNSYKSTSSHSSCSCSFLVYAHIHRMARRVVL